MLVAATAVLRAPGEEAESEGGPQPPELATIAGVRGFIDPVDNGFWVSKHVDGDRRLDATTLGRLAALPGKGDPPIGCVHVLFSTHEAAEANREALTAVGVETWYVDPETGESRQA